MAKVVKWLLFSIFLTSAWHIAFCETIIKAPLHASFITLDPSKLQDISSLWVSRQIDCQLVRTINGVPQLDAAKNLHYLSPLKLDVQLKQHIKFSDGSELTSKDVLATFHYLREKETEYRNLFNWIDSINIRGKYELIINLKKQTPQFIIALSAPHFPIFSSHFIAKVRANPLLWNFPVSCGGYRVSQNNKLGVELLPNGTGFPIKFIFVPATEVRAEDVDKFDLIPMNVVGNSINLKNFYTVNIFDPYQFYFALNSRISPWKDRGARCSVFAKLNPDAIIRTYGSKVKAADDLIPSGVLGYKKNSLLMRDIYSAFSNHKIPKKKSFCVSVVGTSIEESYRAIYMEMIHSLYPNASEKLINSSANLNDEIKKQKCDGIFYAEKSNYLDAYEYIQALSTPKNISPSGYYDSALAKLIIDSQSIGDPLNRAKKYYEISKTINQLCLLYPLFTMPYDQILVRNTYVTPGLGQGPINEYYLGNVSYKK